MTREEARIKLIAKREELMRKYMFEEAEVLTIAIEALQTPPISQRSMYQAGYRQAKEDGPKGHWKIYGTYDSKGRCTGDRTIICDRCSTREVIRFGQKTWDFCPNCGADMRGDQNETSESD